MLYGAHREGELLYAVGYHFGVGLSCLSTGHARRAAGTVYQLRADPPMMCIIFVPTHCALDRHVGSSR